jgi:host factor-I protein
MNRQPIILQDVFLNHIRKERAPVTIHLTNGFQMKGIIRGFDGFTVILQAEGRQVMLYKHSISSIASVKPVIFNGTAEREFREMPVPVSS